MGGADPFAWPAAAVIRAWVPAHAPRGPAKGAPWPPTTPPGWAMAGGPWLAHPSGQVGNLVGWGPHVSLVSYLAIAKEEAKRGELAHPWQRQHWG